MVIQKNDIVRLTNGKICKFQKTEFGSGGLKYICFDYDERKQVAVKEWDIALVNDYLPTNQISRVGAWKSRTTCGKVGWESKTDAEISIMRIEHHSTRDKKPVRAYLCPDCGYWHLTSMNNYQGQ